MINRMASEMSKKVKIASHFAAAANLHKVAKETHKVKTQ